MKTEQSLDRSAMFTALLDLAPGYGRLDTREGEKVTTAALQAWLKTGPEEKNMYDFARRWLRANRPELFG